MKNGFSLALVGLVVIASACPARAGIMDELKKLVGAGTETPAVATPAAPKSIEQLQADVAARSWVLNPGRNIVTQGDVDNYNAAVKALNDALNPPAPAPSPEIQQLQATVAARSWVLHPGRNIVTQGDVDNYNAAVKALNDALNPPAPAPSPEIQQLQATVAARSWVLHPGRNIVTQGDVDNYNAAVKALNDALAAETASPKK